MARLLDGQPIRSDGKLTIKSLAEEAGLKRWVLTHKHTDLQAEFRARIELVNEIPGPLKKVNDQLEAAKERISKLSAELMESRATLERYARITHVLTLEVQKAEQMNLELMKQLAGSTERQAKN